MSQLCPSLAGVPLNYCAGIDLDGLRLVLSEKTFLKDMLFTVMAVHHPFRIVLSKFSQG